MTEAIQRDTLEFDVLILGAGPAGLSAAIRLGQLNQLNKSHLSICVIEKAASIGAHILSGAVFEPRALNELLPNWEQEAPFLRTAVTKDSLYFLTKTQAIPLPKISSLKNHGNYIISLGSLCQWLAQQAQKLGVDVFCGFSGSKVLYEKNKVIGVQTQDVGIDSHGNPTDRFQPGVQLLAKQTLFAEGCRGYLTESLIKRYNLRHCATPQTYGIGIKELWEIPAQSEKKMNQNEGRVIHTVGWPLDRKTYGGGFVYQFDHKISLGFVVGLDYQNPYLDPFQVLQLFKTHPVIKKRIQGGRCIGYGARALNEGGFQSIPHLSFPGGLLIGCSAGFVNVGKLKGTHTAMKSGMLAAETIVKNLKELRSELIGFNSEIKNSWIHSELKAVRNVRPSFKKGLWWGLGYTGIDQFVFRGKAPWTFSIKKTDSDCLLPASHFHPILYPKPDGKETFDRLSLLPLSGVHHNEKQVCHLKLKDPTLPVHYNLPQFDFPEQRYCPAKVYELVTIENEKKLQINFSNCLHCKACEIKDPKQNIRWVVPEGGDGPNYDNL